MKVSVNANVTVGEKPNQYYAPYLTTSDYIDLEQAIFPLGGFNFYTGSSAVTSTISPVGEILLRQKNGIITATDANAQINALRLVNYKDDLNKYFYQHSINQQYAINLSGGGANNQYFFSAGFDNNQPNLTYNSYQRFTLNASNTYTLFRDRLQVTAGIQYTQSNTYNNNPGFSNFVPELRLVDENGNPLSVGAKLRQGYTDTAGQGKLLDWNYRPLEEARLSDNVIKLINYSVNLGIKYRILSGFDFNLLYQYNNGNSSQQNYNSQSTFYTRDLINRYTNINFSSGVITYGIPVGGIVDFNNQFYFSHQLRGLFNYTHNWGSKHLLTALGGGEIKSYDAQNRTYTLYGYDKNIQTSINVNFVTPAPQYSSVLGSTLPIPNNVANLGTTNHYLSYFANLGYTYSGRYVLSLSTRQDASNIYGVSTNQKTVPLWSAGIKWQLDKESFYHLSWLPYLRPRITYGYNANSNTTVSALTTETYSFNLNQWNQRLALLQNPPNPLLRWEKINILNVGIDFGIKNDFIRGSIEYYTKRGTDILGNAPVAPQLGTTQFFGNLANTKGNGIDVAITSRNIYRTNFQWVTDFLFSYTIDKITNYELKPSTIHLYVLNNTNIVNPLEGFPVNSVMGYKFAGLDSIGRPKFIVDGKVSTTYSGLTSSTNFDNLNYAGPATPVYFGNFRNTFTFKRVSLSFNIIYKMGYYFRNPFVTSIASGGSGAGQVFQDYLSRWQKSGDEQHTNIPAYIYGTTDGRSTLYAYSDANILRGDHIRLQDIQISYDLSKQYFPKSPFSNARFYLYLNNLGIIWRANNKGIDPDANTIGAFPNPRTYAMGVKLDF
jgi:hypothetical protein